MTTTIILNNHFVTIEWFFEERGDEIRNHWYEWYMTGTSNTIPVKHYSGVCEADEDHDLKHFEVTEIEEIELVNEYVN